MTGEIAEADARVAAWIEAHVGGGVERLERQPRWRGGWWADVRKDGTLVPLYVREERKEDFPPWPLEHEARVLEVLARHGVPCPKVWGICPDPHAIIMDTVPGTTSFAGTTPAQQRAVAESLAEAVAKMHAIDPAELVGPGLPMPETPEQISLGCFRLCEAMYLKGKSRPEPRIEFVRRWIERNIPAQRRKVSVLSIDSGQFLHDGEKVTALFDMEYACLGDPLIDLASIPGRMEFEGVADVRPFFRRYAELSGDELDPAVITFHRIWWGLCTPLIVTPNLHAPPEGATYFDYITWYVSPMLGVFLALAGLKGIPIDLSPPPVPQAPSRWATIYDAMAARVPPPQAGEPYAVTEQRKFIEFARRIDACRAVEDGMIAEVAALTGEPVADWQTADAALERFVLNAGPEHDEALIALMLRWTVAQAATLLDGPGYNMIAYLHRAFPDFEALVKV